MLSAICSMTIHCLLMRFQPQNCWCHFRIDTSKVVNLLYWATGHQWLKLIGVLLHWLPPTIQELRCQAAHPVTLLQTLFWMHKKAMFAPQVPSPVLVLVFSELHLLFCILLLFNLVNVFSWFLFDLIYCYALPLLLFICQFLLFIFFCRFAIQMVIGT